MGRKPLGRVTLAQIDAALRMLVESGRVIESFEVIDGAMQAVYRLAKIPPRPRVSDYLRIAREWEETRAEATS